MQWIAMHRYSTNRAQLGINLIECIPLRSYTKRHNQYLALLSELFTLCTKFHYSCHI